MALMSLNQNNSKIDRRLVYFDYFRALAILLIILGHCYNSWPRSHIWEATLVNLISGGTALFVFISGFFSTMFTLLNTIIGHLSKTKHNMCSCLI